MTGYEQVDESTTSPSKVTHQLEEWGKPPQKSAFTEEDTSDVAVHHAAALNAHWMHPCMPAGACVECKANMQMFSLRLLAAGCIDSTLQHGEPSLPPTNQEC
jgi:hypothetical protein